MCGVWAELDPPGDGRACEVSSSGDVPSLPIAAAGTQGAAQGGGGDDPFVQGSQCPLEGQEPEAQGVVRGSRTWKSKVSTQED